MEVSGKASEDPSVLREKRRINSVDEEFELFADEIDEADIARIFQSYLFFALLKYGPPVKVRSELIANCCCHSEQS